MSEQNIIEIPLTDEQRIIFAAVLRAAHAPGYKHKAAFFAVVTDSYVPESECSVLRLQVAMVEWKIGEKVAKILTKEALPIEESSPFTPI